LRVLIGQRRHAAEPITEHEALQYLSVSFRNSPRTSSPTHSTFYLQPPITT
jgi:hypothetical protein